MNKKPKMKLVIGVGGKPGMGDDESKEGSFPMPEGYDMEDKKPGDEFEAVCTLKVEDGGRLCVTKVEGMDVPGYDDKEEKDEGEAPEKGSFVKSVFGKDEEQPKTEEEM